MSAEAGVAKHYGRGGLEEKILKAIKDAGINVEHVTVEELAPMDEFHVGGLESTKELAAQLELKPGMRVLDVGSGLGGPARYFAAAHGCRVSGVDLTEEFVQVAGGLTRLAKLEAMVDFQAASALNMPFEAGTFDQAYMIHVGMNIPDKNQLFREVRRVLKPGGLFVVFDWVRTGPGAMRYPVPWAENDATSFMANAKEYREAMEGAGLRVERERGRGESASAAMERMMAGVAKEGLPALGLHLLIGEKMPLTMKNAYELMKDGTLEPTEIVARAV